MGSIATTNSSTSPASSECGESVSGVSNIVERCSLWQCDRAVCESVQDDTRVGPGDTPPMPTEHWEQPSSSRVSATQWLIQSTGARTAAYPQRGSATLAVAVDDTVSAENWTIRTADGPAGVGRLTYASVDSRTSTAADAASDSDCSDPLVCAAQELVAAAVASSTPGVHAAVADSAALLNSGAMLLLGHASTTMQGSNTAQAPPSPAQNQLIAPDDCRSHLLSDFQSDPAVPAAVSAVATRQQQRMLVPELGATDHQTASPHHPSRHNSRRRLGLLVDSSAGMQQLCAGVSTMSAPCPNQHSSVCQEQTPGPLPDACLQAKADQQQDPTHQFQRPRTAGLMRPCSQMLSSQHRQQLETEGPVRQLSVGGARPHVRQSPSAEDASVPQGVTCESGSRAPPAAAATAVIPSADDQLEVYGPGTSSDPVGHAADGDGFDECDAADAVDETSHLPGVSPRLQGPAWQLLSGSSLASLPVLGKSNSSLTQVGLSNCKFMHLDSISTNAGSMASSTSYRPPSLQGSFRSGGGAFSISGGHPWSTGDGSFTSQRHNLAACMRLNSFSSFTSAPGGPGGSFTAAQDGRFASRHQFISGSPHRGSMQGNQFIRFGSFSAATTNVGLFEGRVDGSFTSQRHSGATTATNITGCIRLGSFTSGAAGAHGGYGGRVDHLRCTTGRQPSFTGLPPVFDTAASEPLVSSAACLASAAPPVLDRPALLPLQENTSSWTAGRHSSAVDLLLPSAPKATQELCQATGPCMEQQQKPPAPQQLIYLFD